MLKTRDCFPILQHQYGVTEITGFKRTDHGRGGWIRTERWTSKRDGREVEEYSHVVSENDMSDCHGGGYDPKCGWCWLGAAHSEAAHEASKAVPHS